MPLAALISKAENRRKSVLFFETSVSIWCTTSASLSLSRRVNSRLAVIKVCRFASVIFLPRPSNFVFGMLITSVAVFSYLLQSAFQSVGYLPLGTHHCVNFFNRAVSIREHTRSLPPLPRRWRLFFAASLRSSSSRLSACIAHWFSVCLGRAPNEPSAPKSWPAFNEINETAVVFTELPNVYMYKLRETNV